MTRFTEEVKNYIDHVKQRGGDLNVYALLGWLVSAMTYNHKTYKYNQKERDLLNDYIDMIINDNK